MMSRARCSGTARRISAEELSARLNLPATDDEVGRLAATFDAMLARLDESFRREHQFIADASHELRLTAFVGLPWLSFVYTVLWVVGITNAFNLLDNMDGLSAGVAVVASASFFAVAAMTQQYFLAALLAERSIDVQYYLYHGDLVGRLLTWQLLQAADRGVRVRLLVDDMDLAGRDLAVAALHSHPNMEVASSTPSCRPVY
jgi:hypothetical protein